MTQEGFWRHADDKNSDLPFPEAGNPWDGQAEFLMRLGRVEGAAEAIAYRGWSNCRLCCRPNGSVTYRFGGWEWPEGYAHYIRAHNVRATPEFADFISKYG